MSISAKTLGSDSCILLNICVQSSHHFVIIKELLYSEDNLLKQHLPSQCRALHGLGAFVLSTPLNPVSLSSFLCLKIVCANMSNIRRVNISALFTQNRMPIRCLGNQTMNKIKPGKTDSYKAYLQTIPILKIPQTLKLCRILHLEVLLYNSLF